MNAFSSSSAFRNATPVYTFSDQNAVEILPSRERRQGRANVLKAITLLPQIAEARGYATVLDTTIAVAMDVIQTLPENRPMPKVAVDEDGCALLVWDSPVGGFAMTVEGAILHATVNPGARSTHLPPKVYAGYLPPVFLASILF